jgi:CheY-like chemotaxis protein
MGQKMVQASDKNGSGQPENDLHTFRVLLADDDLEFRKMVAWYLRREGFDVVECADGYCLQRHLGLTDLPDPADRFDVVIADNRMPGPSGLQVLEAAARYDRDVPFILITAFADEKTTTEARRLGAAQVLSKPFDIEDLIAEVCQIAPMGLFISTPVSFSEQDSGEGPDFTLDITYRHHQGSGYITTVIRHYAARLNPLARHIGVCRVVIEGLGQTRQQTTRYRVCIHLTTDAETIVVEHDSDMGSSFENLYLAIKRAFTAAGRRLRHELGKRQHHERHKTRRNPAIHQ